MTLFLLSALGMFLLVLTFLLICGGAVQIIDGELVGGVVLILLGCLAGAGVQAVNTQYERLAGANQAQVTVTLQG